MKLKMLFFSGCVSAAMIAFTVPAMALQVHECVAGRPTPASYTWNFKGETNTIFQDVHFDAQQALNHADELQSLVRDDLSWESQGIQLDAIKYDVNHIEAKVCRLESIRRVVAPWQKAEIDRIAATTRLMADNTQDAILFVNAHRRNLWLPMYRKYTENLYNEARNLTHSVGKAVEYASASKEYRNLRHGLEIPASS